MRQPLGNTIYSISIVILVEVTARIVMYTSWITITFCLVRLANGAYYLPSIVWDQYNPILRKEFWRNVVNVKTFDVLTFICAHPKFTMAGHESIIPNSKLSHNLYVKEFNAMNTTDFEDACGTQGAKFVTNCTAPNIFKAHDVQINTKQALDPLPTFGKGKDYIFFTTSYTKQSLTTPSKTCAMVFRIHFCQENEECTRPDCFLMGRNEVCPKKIKSTDDSDCFSAPRAVRITRSTNTTIDITWKEPKTTGCNVTHYSICYRPSTEKGCNEILIPSARRSAILEHLRSSVTYSIRVRAHTCKGPGNYSTEIHGVTTGMPIDVPTAEPRTGSKGQNIDLVSIAIGFFIGIAVALCCVSVFWYCKTRIQKKKADENILEEKVKFDRTNDSDAKEQVTVNNAYRESLQNWNLPGIKEVAHVRIAPGEDHSLYVSEA